MYISIDRSGQIPRGKLSSWSRDLRLYLRPGQILRLTGEGRRVQIECTEGKLWVTQSGDRKDYCLVAGQRISFTHARSILIEGLIEGEVIIS